MKAVLIIGACIVTLISFNAPALEYVPPPTGPYQSSVVVNTHINTVDDRMQVYRFPPEDFIPGSYSNLHQPANLPPAEFQFRSPSQRQPESVMPMMPYGRPVQPESSIEQTNVNKMLDSTNSAPAMDTESPGLSQLQPRQEIFYPPMTENPWAVGTHNFQQPYPNQWRQQNYGGQMPYSNMSPYSNNNQGPFSGMPSPWQVMPMQPFFSGR